MNKYFVEREFVEGHWIIVNRNSPTHYGYDSLDEATEEALWWSNNKLQPRCAARVVESNILATYKQMEGDE